jgi:hypothetical protein
MTKIPLDTIAIIAIVSAILALVLWLFIVCWNLVMPVFGFPVLTLLQAWALLTLVAIVGSFFRARK